MHLTAPDLRRFGVGVELPRGLKRAAFRSPLSLRVPGKRADPAFGWRQQIPARHHNQPINRRTLPTLGHRASPLEPACSHTFLGLGPLASLLQDPSQPCHRLLVFHKFTWHVSLVAGRWPTPLGYFWEGRKDGLPQNTDTKSAADSRPNTPIRASRFRVCTPLLSPVHPELHFQLLT